MDPTSPRFASAMTSRPSARAAAMTSSSAARPRAGSAVVIPKGDRHTYWADEDDPWTIWWLHVDGPLVDDWFARVGGRGPVARAVDVFETTSLVDQVLRHLERDTTPASVLAASGAAWHLLTLLAAARTPHDTSGDAIDRAADYLRQHYVDKVTVADLAAMCSLSASHFAALFKRQLGQPVHRFHSELRMARARELLGTTALPVAEVSQAVGFDDPFYFSRQFRRMHGQTPLAYRRQHTV